MKECDPTDDNDKYNTSLDQDLLDEINQILMILILIKTTRN